MEFTPVWLPMSLSVQLWSLRLCGYRCPYNYGVYACVATEEFVRTTMEFTPCVANDEFVRTTMEFTPVWLPMSLSVQLWSLRAVWLPMSLSVQLWSLRLCGYR